MDLSELYKFSSSFGPPKIDIRQAYIMDCWGDDRSAKMNIKHILPDDVTIDELNFYPQAWAFMDVDSLLFYAFAVFKNYKNSAGNDAWFSGVDHYFWTIEDKFEELAKKDNIQILFDAIKQTWVEDECFFDESECIKLKTNLHLKRKI